MISKLLKSVICGYIYLTELYGLLWDKMYSLDTEKNHTLSELELSDRRSHEYRPTEIAIFYKIMKCLKISENDAFLDLGAGKGRVMVLAGKFSFRRIIGVEISNKLAGICEKNIRGIKEKTRPCEYLVVKEDAANYRIPDDVTVIYCYNPFPLEVMNKVIMNIRESIQNSPRTVRFIYYNPMLSDEIEKEHGLSIEQQIPFLCVSMIGYCCKIYNIS